MREYTDHDLLDLEIKYKDNHEILDLIEFIKFHHITTPDPVLKNESNS